MYLENYHQRLRAYLRQSKFFISWLFLVLHIERRLSSSSVYIGDEVSSHIVYSQPRSRRSHSCSKHCSIWFSLVSVSASASKFVDLLNLIESIRLQINSIDFYSTQSHRNFSDLRTQDIYCSDYFSHSSYSSSVKLYIDYNWTSSVIVHHKDERFIIRWCNPESLYINVRLQDAEK